jgi:hypothetical protein
MVLESSVISSYTAWSVGKCIYRCTPCGIKFVHSLSFWNHVSNYHRLNHSEFKRIYPNFMVQKETAVCKACGCTMRLDFGKMTAHMMNKHDGMTLKEYYNKYIGKPGKENNFYLQ